jgi:DNA-binding CsgD family transcriptional regulator
VLAALRELEAELARWLAAAGVRRGDARAAAEQHRGLARELARQNPSAAAELLRTEAEAVRARDPRLAVEMLVDAAAAAVLGGSPEAGSAAARRALALAEGERASTAAAEVALGMCLLLSGEAAEGERLVRAVLQRGEAQLAGVDGALQSAVACLYWLEEYARASTLLERLIDDARATRSPSLPIWLDTAAAIDLRVGRWAAAAGRSREAARLARRLGQSFQESSAHTTLARIAALRGREEECRRHVARALALAGGNELVFVWAVSALGALELGLGRLDAAAAELERLVALGEARVRTDPPSVNALADLTEVYLRLGRRSEAAALFTSFESEALESGRAWALAVAHRCRALLGPSAAAEAEFESALALHDARPVPFERARTELCYGEWLRRARRRRHARTRLEAALATFERLGARSWAERARRELAATRGGRSRAADPGEALTAHEREVAARVAQGLTNREIAAALFVTERTVEYHLTNIYAKLGLRRRTELVGMLRNGPEGAPQRTVAPPARRP